MSDVIRRVLVMLTIVSLGGIARADAQTPAPAPPAPPPPPWTGSAGLGLALNRGNTDTTNLNASFEATHDPKTRSVQKFKGLYLRGKEGGTVTLDRLQLEGRHEQSLSKRVYAYGGVQVLKDEFKQIDYLVAPSVGIGYKLVATSVTSFNVDGGVGVKLEKNPGFSRRTDPVITASDKLEHKLSKTATITHSFVALWKAQDFGDALYTFSAGIAASLTTRTQLKVELFDTNASRPPTAAVKNNDVALLTTVVYKF